MDKGLRDYLDATVPESESAEWITPWCYVDTDDSLGLPGYQYFNHAWIKDRDATVCTECSINYDDYVRAMSR